MFSNFEEVTSFNAAWREALERGRGWRSRAMQGRAALIRFAPDANVPALWSE
jgi:hypothetical protein